MALSKKEQLQQIKEENLKRNKGSRDYLKETYELIKKENIDKELNSISFNKELGFKNCLEILKSYLDLLKCSSTEAYEYIVESKENKVPSENPDIFFTVDKKGRHITVINIFIYFNLAYHDYTILEKLTEKFESFINPTEELDNLKEYNTFLKEYGKYIKMVTECLKEINSISKLPIEECSTKKQLKGV